MDYRQKTYESIPRATLERLTGYLNYLRLKSGPEHEYVSSAVIASEMNLSAVTVRKDLAYISNGRPRIGHNREELIERITAALGRNACNEAIVVGVGNLGRALMCYNGFDKYGLRILAGFDVDRILVGCDVFGKPILHIDELPAFVKKAGTRIGIIAVPASQAQDVCDIMVSAGITGIMCFAAAHLFVPSNITVRYEDFAVSLALLSLSLDKTDETADAIEAEI